MRKIKFNVSLISNTALLVVNRNLSKTLQSFIIYVQDCRQGTKFVTAYTPFEQEVAQS